MNGQGSERGDGQRDGRGSGRAEGLGRLHGGPRGDEFEGDLREWMARGAEGVRPAAAPYPEIVRQGRAARRRRLAVAGAALFVLAVVPATTLAFAGYGAGDDGPAERVSVAGDGPGPSTAPPSPQPPPGPAAPATPGQLTDGITLQEAAAGLEKCLAYDRQHSAELPYVRPDPGRAAEYRILLALRSPGNDNSPGEGQFIVAVKDAPSPARIICGIKEGEASSLNTSTGAGSDPVPWPVAPDINGGKLYLQRMRSEGAWQLPYRWGSIGTVTPDVARVTVGYGGATVEAALDRGWFAATGVLDRAVTEAPRIKGYDAQGKQVYDSTQDKGYDKTIP
ncbi:hypothetical protein ABZY44_16135 [Streptomyces sp. NPDC006544]|uniref:hypothetical protein n=1 Tax=Streptomyces sp. NPDC006544 TaxID=3154583 RepID=UPI0033BF21B7